MFTFLLGVYLLIGLSRVTTRMIDNPPLAIFALAPVLMLLDILLWPLSILYTFISSVRKKSK